MKKEVQVYIHIPFCIRKCRYCTACVITGDFTSKAAYLLALKKELAAAVPMLSDYRIADLYIGGGSPSVMRPDELAKIVYDFKQRSDMLPHAETTIELMPQTVGTPSLTGLGHGGFTRFSLSMQSIENAELKTIDCGFDAQDVQNAILFLDRFRMSDTNLDIMYGIPGQTERSWMATLHAVRDFMPTHVSVYPFPGGDGLPSGVVTDTGGILYDSACSFLKEMGFSQYTKYHFARQGFESSYVVNRFNGMEYIGFGLGARSFVDGMVYANSSDWATYIAHSDDFERLVKHVRSFSPNQIEAYRKQGKAMLLESEC